MHTSKRREALRRFGDRARSVGREEAKGAMTAVEMEAAAKVVGQEVMEVRVEVRAVGVTTLLIRLLNFCAGSKQPRHNASSSSQPPRCWLTTLDSEATAVKRRGSGAD